MKRSKAVLIEWLARPIPLERKGYHLKAESRAWEMRGFFSEQEQQNDKEFFSAETHSGDKLFLFRPKGEKGMREIYLFGLERPAS